MKYNWQQSDWTQFSYNPDEVENNLFAFAEETGLVSGILQTLPENVRLEAIIDTMVAEAIKTSAIEGEYISRHDVVSSIRNKLGLDKVIEPIKDQRARGAGELMVDIRQTLADPLTKEKLYEWHRILLKQSKDINIGVWRKDSAPMQVISSAIGREIIHFEAPPSDRVSDEMNRFIQWFNDTAPGGKNEIRKAPVRAASAHLYFESIHPFEDGNGRIGRAIAEKALSQTIGRPLLLSISRTLENNKSSYYANLEEAQRSNEITKWVIYFTDVILTAQKQTKLLVEFTLKKTKFFDRFKSQLNDRQLKAVKKMWDAGTEGFTGGMTAKKYISITKVSKATATRDLQTLVESGIFILQGAGRNVHYHLNLH
ncbi:Fic family protein [Chitinophaga nivalis]|uniref:Fic family protein n=1 Tax=Chitinophaga nivalis TaxID=2991709 RepID=A0ABT3ITL6_9BACT|nr:Fic family protein [Chitinophaga nivalis]MCW3462994.1 Fic family protein [Chitinophaga nivalis]MCW3487316.1 Fic family protein [Chitinophaga nivalis]